MLFFGTLRYPPNIEALERLAPDLADGAARPPGRDRTDRRVGTHGTRPRALRRAAVGARRPNFASLTDVASRARVAVAPLDRTAGIQIKVLDAASLALPQVVTSAALRGYAAGFPLEPHDDDAAFAAEIVRLLEHPADARAEGAAAARHAQEHYSVGAWAPWAADLLAGDGQPSA